MTFQITQHSGRSLLYWNFFHRLPTPVKPLTWPTSQLNKLTLFSFFDGDLHTFAARFVKKPQPAKRKFTSLSLRSLTLTSQDLNEQKASRFLKLFLLSRLRRSGALFRLTTRPVSSTAFEKPYSIVGLRLSFSVRFCSTRSRLLRSPKMLAQEGQPKTA